MIIDMQKIWMAYINALRPAANRHGGAGTDSDHQRMDSELRVMSQDENRRSARHAKRDLIDPSGHTPEHNAPYDQRMSDRFVTMLATR